MQIKLIFTGKALHKLPFESDLENELFNIKYETTVFHQLTLRPQSLEIASHNPMWRPVHFLIIPKRYFLHSLKAFKVPC